MITFNTNEIISSADLNSNFTEAVGGAWTSYTPTLTPTAIGNGTIVASYIKRGKTVHFKIKLTIGSTTDVQPSTTFTLPVTASSTVYKLNATGGTNIGLAVGHDTGTATVYTGTTALVSTTTLGAYFPKSNATYLKLEEWSGTPPFAWDTDDILTLIGTYEAL